MIEILKSGNMVLIDKLLQTLIKNHEPERIRLKQLHDRYTTKSSGTPIKRRQMPQKNKINNKLNNSFFSMIVDTKAGYFAGNGFTYKLNKEDYENEARCLQHSTILHDFLRRSSMKALDAQIATMASVCGYGVRLLYINPQGKETATNLNPWEVIFLSELQDVEQAAIRYYTGTDYVNGEFVDTQYVEVYMNTHILFYKLVNDTFMMHQEPRIHAFKRMPVIKFRNNPEEMSDGERVFELIDAYDRSMSDLNSEVEQMRLAYMVFKGYEPTDDTIKAMTQTGAFGIDENAEVAFLTKDINATAIETHLDRLEKNILRFASSVDLTDESFGSNLSGIAIRYKLIGLEQKTVATQMQFQQSLQQQFEVLSTAWQLKSVDMHEHNVEVSFDRNLPTNILEEIEQNAKLKGLVSELTRIGRLPFINNPEQELLKLQEDTSVLTAHEEVATT